jgi:competence protein ComEC
MLPIVHTVFGVTTLWQLLSPLLSLLFIPFYPLVIALHCIGFGGVLDDSLIKLFTLPKVAIESILSIEMVLGYLLVSIFAIGSRIFFVLTLLLALLYFGYLYLFI